MARYSMNLVNGNLAINVKITDVWPPLSTIKSTAHINRFAKFRFSQKDENFELFSLRIGLSYNGFVQSFDIICALL